MKSIFTFVFVIFSMSALMAQTSHTVIVGGGGINGTPFYNPQFITIDLDDVVVWEWVSGSHTVTSTSGPESFNSGSHASPHIFTRTFTVPGVYEYHCTVGNHSNTQFGSVTVLESSSIDVHGSSAFVALFPNPASDRVQIDGVSPGSLCEVFSLNGVLVLSSLANADFMVLDLGGLPAGCYVIVMRDGESVIRKRLVVQR